MINLVNENHIGQVGYSHTVRPELAVFFKDLFLACLPLLIVISEDGQERGRERRGRDMQQRSS